uniref:Uncharacterized protein n=1 Tax=Oryza sativa subsp. japonica TaxID=39947 RepID=Q9FWF4_ORYSJ|nr:hypothetical protein [Oryza sativa Japonica Group]
MARASTKPALDTLWRMRFATAPREKRSRKPHARRGSRSRAGGRLGAELRRPVRCGGRGVTKLSQTNSSKPKKDQRSFNFKDGMIVDWEPFQYVIVIHKHKPWASEIFVPAVAQRGEPATDAAAGTAWTVDVT